MYIFAKDLFRVPLCKNQVIITRTLFEGVLNKVFNAVDEERRIKFGPNRACAEWLLRNGASVKFKNHSEYLKDYNGLPEEDFPLILEEVFADGASISHYGFDNFKGCKHVSKIQFHNCTFLENVAMDKLLILRECLKHLCISNCQDITDLGLLKLAGLKLATLELSNLRYVENKKDILTHLRKNLPQCNIQFK